MDDVIEDLSKGSDLLREILSDSEDWTAKVTSKNVTRKDAALFLINRIYQQLIDA